MPIDSQPIPQQSAQPMIPQPETNPQLTPTIKKPSSMTIYIILFIILALCTAAIGSYLVTHQTRVSTTTSTAISSPLKTQTEGPMTDWKEYKGQEINFKYPPSWSIKEYFNIPDVDDSVTISGQDVQSTYGFRVNSITVVFVRGKSSMINDTVFATSCQASGEECVSKNIQIDEISAIQRDYFAPSPWGVIKTEKHRVTTVSKGELTIFIKQERYIENENIFLEPYEQILSTFEFVK